MSLILLSAVDEPFTARDIAGRVLPFATLDFFVAGTSERADLGDDDGHFEADADGVFETIDLETGVEYRVVHKTAEGVLLFDVDPYVCTCDEDAYQFRNPIQRALDGDGRIAPGAELYAFEADGETPQALYADPDFTTPLPNPVVANAAGIFKAPMYASDDASYVLTLLDADGNMLDEFDPYECQCGAIDRVNYVVGTAGEAWKTSFDGITWSAIAKTDSTNRIIYLSGRNRWLAVGLTEIYVSDDPVAAVWVDVTPTGWGGSSVVDVDYDESGDVICALADSGEIFRSTDGGDTWTQVLSIGGKTPRSIYHDAPLGVWIMAADDATGVDYYTSPTGATWTEVFHLNTSGGGDTYRTVGNGSEVLTFGVSGNFGGVQRTTNATSWSGLGNMPRADAIYGDHNGTYYGTNGTNGSNRVFQRSTTGASGSWSEVTVGTTATLGINRECRADPTRSRWWLVYRRRVFRSDVANGASWNDTGLTGTLINCIGVRPA